ncbi:MAG: mitochondrial fusion and transport protein ugo1 [Bogoriella megaspora]|nr:MAG: mitochondrial fusion and transport protein ugo1 [Bogoriella megaspora]
MERSNIKPITMTTSSDAPNPLRPYYRPPSVGVAYDTPQSNASAHTIPGSNRTVPVPRAKSFGTSARDILSDLDYGDYLPESSPSTSELVKRLANQAVWKYTSVFLAQPFEVAKIVLQCHLASTPDTTRRPPYGSSRTPSKQSNISKYSAYPEISPSEESSDDEPSYFTSTAPKSTAFASPSPSHPPRRRTPSRSNSATPTPSSYPSSPPYKLEIRHPNSVLDALSQIWQRENAFGLWKATNATFVYSVLLKTIESWTRSLLSAILSLPDPGIFVGTTDGVGGLDIVDSPNSLASLAVTVAAAGIAGTILAPLDLIRTRFVSSPALSICQTLLISSTSLILTPSTYPPRHLLPSLRSLPTLIIPASILSSTILTHTLPSLLSASTPLLLRSSLRIDPVLTPTAYNFFTFLSSAGELFLKLPLETVLRRGHVAVLHENATRDAHVRRKEKLGSFSGRGRTPVSARHDPKVPAEELQTIVDVGPYRGVLGTMWYIVREEGVRVQKPVPGRVGMAPKQQKGQGLAGLWRGWSVGMWGLVGVWGALGMGAGSGPGQSGEF